jgi:hypothetical protein
MISLFLFACEDSETNNIQNEVDALDTDGAKQKYLEAIMYRDQVYRKKTKELIQKYGHSSPEVQENERAMVMQDKVNIKKIKAYLDTYGYPSITRYGSEANTAPWMVFHHSGDFKLGQEYFSLFYKSWKDKVLGADDFSFYLNRLHRIKNGSLIKMPGAFRDEQLIDTLIRTLKLEPVRGTN